MQGAVHDKSRNFFPYGSAEPVSTLPRHVWCNKDVRDGRCICGGTGSVLQRHDVGGCGVSLIGPMQRADTPRGHERNRKNRGWHSFGAERKRRQAHNALTCERNPYPRKGDIDYDRRCGNPPDRGSDTRGSVRHHLAGRIRFVCANNVAHKAMTYDVAFGQIVYADSFDTGKNPFDLQQA